jgi:hypothetical protein
VLRVVGDGRVGNELSCAGGLRRLREGREQARAPRPARVLRGGEADRERAAIDESPDLVRGDNGGSPGEAVGLDGRSLLRAEAAEPVARELDRLRADTFVVGPRGAGDERVDRARSEGTAVPDAVERRVGIRGGFNAENRLRPGSA